MTRRLYTLLTGIGLLCSSIAIAADSPTPVTLETLSEVAIFPVRTAPATAISLNDTRISAEISGIVRQLPVKVGDRVDAGEAIARLDCEDYLFAQEQAQAALDAATAQQEFAAYQFERAQRLAVGGSISKEQVRQHNADTAVTLAEVAGLQAALNMSERNVAKCLIRAPFSAVVIERIASVGELAVPGTVLLRLLDDENIEISAKVQEQDLPGLQSAELIRFVSRNKKYEAAVRAILPVMDSKIRSYEVRLVAKGQAAPPGATGRLEWTSSIRHLPPELLVQRDGALGVFVEDEGRARFVAINSAQEGRPAAVQLPPATRIIVDGRFNLSDQDPVRVTTP